MTYWDRENAGEDVADLSEDNLFITICAACKSHHCAAGNLYCDEYKTADLIRIPLSEYEKIRGG